LLQTPAIVFCDVDSIMPARGKALEGFDEFSAALEHAAIPIIWVTNRTRLQIDEPRRRMGHAHPFIAEGGCGSYLPEGYFHLRPAKTLRLGRFTCLPVAEPQPAASEALEELAEKTGISVVTLRSLAPRELAQNSGLPAQQAELLRQRDFDELFFFAGASDSDIARFVETARQQRRELRHNEPIWSLAVGASLKQCVRDLVKLYERALRYQPKLVAIVAESDASGMAAVFDRGFLLATSNNESSSTPKPKTGFRRIPLGSPGFWRKILDGIGGRG
jgi:predicted mannosyl-3-phosphoglycerate phosphatase (HAD superfamily)